MEGWKDGSTARPVTAPHCTATTPKSLPIDPSQLPNLIKTHSKFLQERTRKKYHRKYLDQTPQNARPSNPPPHLRRHNNPLVLHRILHPFRLPNQLLHPIPTPSLIKNTLHIPILPILPRTPPSQNPQQRRLRPRAHPPRHLQTRHLEPRLRRRARRRLAVHTILHARRSPVLFIHAIRDVETGVVSVG